MSGMEGIGGFSANVPATEQLSTIRKQITETIHSKVEGKLNSAGVSEETREVLMADVTQMIERQMSSGELPNSKAMRETIGGIFLNSTASEFQAACRKAVGGLRCKLAQRTRMPRLVRHLMSYIH